MKAVITGDWHIGLTSHGVFDSEAGMNSRLIDIKVVADEIIDYAVSNGIDHFFHLGDLFHTNHPTPTEIAMAQTFLNRLSDRGIGTLVISGNHDFVQGARLDPIEMFSKQKWPNVLLISTPKIIELEAARVRLVVIPHCSQSELMRFLETANLPQDDKINVLLCHTMFAGCQVGSEDRMMASGINMLSKELNVHVVFSGHIHKPQKLVSAYAGHVDVYHPGSPLQMDFAERNDVKEFIVCEFKDRMFGVTHHEIKNGRRLVQIETCDYRTWGDLSGAIVKAVIPESLASGWTVDDIEYALKLQGAQHISSIQIVSEAELANEKHRPVRQTEKELMWSFLQDRLGPDAEAGWYEAQEVLADVKRTASKS